ncbi:MAG: flagellar basal body-associated FliL family protein [Neomegalonema sp.]|nr:flagellar basal body-associated FliL family protein [Neomegalonema sp.]
MRLILPILLAIIGVAAGGAVGYMYKSSLMKKEAEIAKKLKGDKGEKSKDGHKDKHGAKDKDAHAADKGKKSKKAKAAKDSEYVPLGRKLIVPFQRKSGVKAFVAVDATLEIGPGEKEFVTAHEPKVVDAFIRTLVRFAATGAFEDPSRASETLDELNKELYKAASGVLGERVRGVLIANLLTQDE